MRKGGILAEVLYGHFGYKIHRKVSADNGKSKRNEKMNEKEREGSDLGMELQNFTEWIIHDASRHYQENFE